MIGIARRLAKYGFVASDVLIGFGSTNMHLNSNIREKTKKLFGLLGRSQNAFCKKYDISAPSFSSALSGKRGIPTFLWAKVVAGLEQEAGEIKLDIYSKATASSLLTDLIESTGRAVLHSNLPGGAIPVGAKVYIERRCDNAIVDLLDRGARLFSLVGSPQSGRSSLLLRVAARARDREIHVISVDFSFLPTLSPVNAIGAVGIGWMSELASAAGLAVRTEQPDHEFADQIFDHLHALQTKTVLVLDGVDRLGLNDPRAAQTILHFLLRLSTSFAMRSPRKFAAVVTTGAERRTVSSAFSTQSMRIETMPFSLSETSQLAEIVVGRTMEESVVESVLRLFGGHPYLTHLFFEDVFAGRSVSDATDAALAFQGPYGVHADRILRRVQRVALGWPEGLVADFSTLCKEIAGLAEKKEVLRFRHELGLFGVDVSRKPPCEFYRRAFLQAATL